MLPEPIRYLAQAYFHQDYDLEAETPVLVLESFRDMESTDNVDALRIAIQELISSGKSEDELAELWIEQARASYDPRDDGIEMSEWFVTTLDCLT